MQHADRMLQDLADSLATRLQRSVAIDDPQVKLLAASRHFGDEDRARIESGLRLIDPDGTALDGDLDPVVRAADVLLDLLSADAERRAQAAVVGRDERLLADPGPVVVLAAAAATPRSWSCCCPRRPSTRCGRCRRVRRWCGPPASDRCRKRVPLFPRRVA